MFKYKVVTIMDVYNERRLLAEKQRKIYLELINSLTSNKVYEPNLSEIPTQDLLDFYLYTSGFIGVCKNEDLRNILSEEDCKNILNGLFFLETYSQTDAEYIMSNCDIDISENPCPKRITLVKSKDGEYYLERDRYISEKNYTYKLMLKTEPINISGRSLDRPIEKQPTIIDNLNLIRICFVHNTPLIDGNNVVFNARFDDQTITTSKMWLRGFTETLCRLDKSHNVYALYNYLYKACETLEIDLNNEEELRLLINKTISIFPESAHHRIDEICDFLSLRVKYSPQNFYKLPLDEKFDILSDIITYNKSYIEKGKGQLNCNILYSIQQFVAKQLEGRQDLNYAISKVDLLRIKSILDRQEKNNQSFNEINSTISSGKFHPTIVKRQIEKLNKEKNAINSERRQLLRDINLNLKLETANLDLIGSLPPNRFIAEYAVALACLLAYNAIITSSFYEELKTDASIIDSKVFKFFDSLPIKNVTTKNPNDNRVNIFNQISGFKYWFIEGVRQGLCHNFITYTLPQTVNNTFNVYDIELSFIDKSANSQYCLSLGDLVNIFSSPIFTNERSAAIKQHTFVLPDFEEDPEIDSLIKEIIDRPNNIIKHIGPGDQE